MPRPPLATTIAVLLLGACGMPADEPAGAEPPAPSARVLLKSGETILGQPVTYPSSARPEILAAIVTLPPGAETGWHRHDVPLYGQVLEGELTVDYEGHGSRVYGTGDALLEAIGTPHNGRNTGAGTTRVLAVFISEEGAANTTPLER